ncbi:50S ribosomal protein L11 methyltransferase [Mesorhizobium sp. B2-3-15]|uniref:50S ribosomal protein L11 methyltransferase n=1 Tax=Mesorhizobium sp. B2-3-15 TaxID=2589949 RepID=UPI00112C4012|nr:50S ribosomal protein L11 methyltransferase [Mesorhizobium sp. B2-3-15]TPL74005.1 hypothetical protein FJ954_09625 [Mesorhizobium sp. B2-3-15]
MSREDIIALVKRETKMIVQTGPFAGLRLHDVQTWGGGEDIGPQLLGVYEQELHSSLLRFTEQSPSLVINVGCAEGYYSVGLARLLPDARVFAFDVDRRAQDASRANAELNGIGERFHVGTSCTPARLGELVLQNPHALIVVDCEGCEKLLFDETNIPALRKANVVTELHEFTDRNILRRLTDLFSSSHKVSVIRSGPRDPHEFTFLDRSADSDKWLLICENRPELQRWLVCERRASAETLDLNGHYIAQPDGGESVTASPEIARVSGARPYEIDEGGKLRALYRPLICTIVYGPDEYFECLRCFLTSLDRFGKYRGEIAVISDRPLHQIIDFIPRNLRDSIVFKRERGLSHISRYKLNEFGFDKYSPIFYFDNDIVIETDLEAVIYDVFVSGGVCVSTEVGTYSDLSSTSIKQIRDTRRIGNWFGLDLLLADSECSNQTLPLANSGIIGFCNQYDFTVVSDIVQKMYIHPEHQNLIRYFGDQPLLNYALVKTRLGLYNVFDGKCRFAAVWGLDQNSRCGFLHFVWARGEEKWKQMKSYIEFLNGEATGDVETTGSLSEATWYRRWQAAQYLNEVGDEAGFVRVALESFRDRPSRAEPLHALARYYLDRSRGDVSMDYADAGLWLSAPSQDEYGVEPQVYSTGLKEAFTIAASYSRDSAKKERGRQICNWLSITRAAPDNVRGLARYNYRWFVETASTLMPSIVYHPLSVPAPDGYKPGNVSIARFGQGFVVFIRAVNYDLLDSGFFDRHGDTSFRQRTLLVYLDDSFQVVSSAEVLPPEDMPPPRHFDSLGFEDPRPLIWHDRLWCLSSVRQLNEQGRAEMVLARVDQTPTGQYVLADWRVLPSGMPGQWEKNWMPHLVGDELRFVYSVDPTRIINDVGEVVFNEPAQASVENFRGGTQAIPFDSGWLMLIHEWELVGTRRNYFHRFIWFDANNRLGLLTRRFFFRQMASEFAAGLAWHLTGDHLVVSFGIDDHDPTLAVVKADEVRRALSAIEDHQKASERACEAGRPMWESMRQGHQPLDGVG